MKRLSVIVPCYNEEENVRDFYDELCRNEDLFRGLKYCMWTTGPGIRRFPR